ncbi:MAG: cysteine--tRNA ligase, partial [Candidatus Omnitrophica bacterium]|nr:cysteine--tRNA ligase [Candidatus Omnitrophota bacterium]
GHARSAYIFDVIRCYFEYKGYKVKFVRNVTDVDDKIIEKAKKERLTVKEVSQKYLDVYHDGLTLLGIGKPDKEPKATEYIPKMVKFIELLIKNGCAYEAGGDVYFDIKKAKNYGKLSNQSLEKMEVGARIAPGEKKQDPLDFALWKKAKEDEPSWDSPWGKGRPGWHIECSVMSSSLLGDEFDIHGGGIDLIFPHHENEIAQSEGAGYKFARVWLHNGLLTINGEKMAKSLGNFISIKDFLARYKDPDYLKLFFLSAHYRSPIDYTEGRMEEAKKEKERFVILLDKIKRMVKSEIRNPKSEINPKSKIQNELINFRKKFEEAMDDDFNTPLALASLFDLVTYANKFIQEGKDEGLPAIGKLVTELSSIFALNLAKDVRKSGLDEKAVLKLIYERNKARNEKDFKRADEIRKRLSDRDIILEDTKEGTVWRLKV